MCPRTRSIRTLSVIFLLILGLMVIPGGAIAVSASESTDESVRFADAQRIEQQGDFVKRTLVLNNTDEARLQIASAEGDFSATVSATDGSGDGAVTVVFDTRNANDPDAAFRTADANDTISVLTRPSATAPETLPTGRYNVIASAGQTRIADRLWIEPPSVRGSAACSVPATQQPDTIDCTDRSREGGSPVVAVGDDAVVQYRVSGLESSVQRPAPGTRSVFARNASTGAHTTHVVQWSPQADVRTSQTLRVNYREGRSPSLHSSRLIDHIGIDTDADGEIDRSLRTAVNRYQVTSTGGLTVAFDEPISVADNETLLFEYHVVNPRTEGVTDASVSFGGETVHSSLEYAPSGLGNVGPGVDLRVESSEMDLISPQTVFDVAYDAETDTLNVVADSTRLETGTYNVTAVIDTDIHADGDRVVLTEAFTVAEPSVDNLSATMAGTKLNVSAQTNLAPQTKMDIDLTMSQEGTTYFSRCLTTVGQNGVVACDFTPPRTGTANVSISYNDTVVAGPKEIEIESNVTTRG
ncbi:putative secreted glycoprotein [Haloferax volcanii DS2]|uniref:Secreted glycoprotein n=2 Tax=Haloferax volcanii (strain ATCC 29605 / DSM 3757 / JCM 8879 / NBRC 14742 / NCIMB 2012 / VKM B-1768 / DS2) TaxID=309800 RepID=D4GU84_HALVD|nr:putative secreted glycoprotein [Haloferax volcanii DS2]